MGMDGAAIVADAPDTSIPLITSLAASLAGKTQSVIIAPESEAFRAYGAGRSVERYNCSYGLNETFREALSGGELRISGEDSEGNVRIAELSGHPFYMATLFLPQLSSSVEKPHPLIVHFVKAATAIRGEGRP